MDETPDTGSGGGSPDATPAVGISRQARIARIFVAMPPELVLVVVLVILGFIFWQGSEFFLTTRNMRNVLLSVSVLGILAAPGTLLLISGNFDLSVASAAALCGCIAGVVAEENSAAAAILAAIGVGLLAGIFNGVLSAYAGIASIVVTLGTWLGYRGLARLFSNGQTIRMNGKVEFITNDILGVPAQIVMFVLITVLAWFVVRYTRFGRSVYAIGSNPTAARLSGIRQKPTIFVMFIVSGLLAGLAGLILASQLDAASGNAATGVELEVVAAIILGGASLSGGRGTIPGTVLGVFILGIMQNGLTLLSISSFWQDVATGVVLVAAVGLDQVRLRLSGS